MRTQVAIFILVTTIPALAFPADPAANPETTLQSLGLTPLTHSPDLFPILPWDLLRGWKKPYRTPKHGLDSIAECGFTIAGFVKPEDLPQCERLGLAIPGLPTRTPPPSAALLKAMVEKSSISLVNSHVDANDASDGNGGGIWLVLIVGTGAFCFVLAWSVDAFGRYQPLEMSMREYALPFALGVVVLGGALLGMIAWVTHNTLEEVARH